MGVLCLFIWNYVNYANMEGFCRDGHILLTSKYDHGALSSWSYTQ